MKILFFSDNYPPETNAAATRVHERAAYWVKWGHQVTVITCVPNFPHGRVFDGYQNKWRQEEIIDGVRVIRVKTYIAANRAVLRRTLDFISYMFTGFLAGVRIGRPDVVVSTSPQFFAAVAAWALSHFRRIPYVFELGDLWPASISAVGAMRPNFGLRLLELLELKMYRDSVAVVALTHAFKDNLVRRSISGDKVHVVINGVDLWRYGPRDPDSDLVSELGTGDKFVIGYVGTHGMAHALKNVLKAAQRLKDHNNIHFLFVGAGAERDMLIEYAKDNDLGNVSFLPSQPKDRMPQVWSVCNVALVHLKDSPAFKEVIPSKIFEAMGMGLPILMAAPEGEATKIISKENVGVCVAPENPDALADAAKVLALDAQQTKKYASASHKAASQYSREAQAQNMIDVLEAVTQSDADADAHVKSRPR